MTRIPFMKKSDWGATTLWNGIDDTHMYKWNSNTHWAKCISFWDGKMNEWKLLKSLIIYACMHQCSHPDTFEHRQFRWVNTAEHKKPATGRQMGKTKRQTLDSSIVFSPFLLLNALCAHQINDSQWWNNQTKCQIFYYCILAHGMTCACAREAEKAKKRRILQTRKESAEIAALVANKIVHET